MFNIFNKTKKTKVSTINAVELVEKIHNEFDTAADRLLDEAKSIIANSDIEKGERLKAIGFNNSVPVKNSEVALQKKQLAEKIEYYQVFYPNNKFITEEEVERICKKYGLLFGETINYIGNIPEKNLKEIEAFVLREEDMKVVTNFDDYIRRESSLRRMQVMSMMTNSMIGREPSYQQPIRKSEPPKELITRKEKPQFKICAPEKDFNTWGMVVRDGFKLEYDPIVLQPVDKGYLVISKWGIEGEDEIVVNQQMN